MVYRVNSLILNKKVLKLITFLFLNTFFTKPARSKYNIYFWIGKMKLNRTNIFIGPSKLNSWY